MGLKYAASVSKVKQIRCFDLNFRKVRSSRSNDSLYGWPFERRWPTAVANGSGQRQFPLSRAVRGSPICELLPIGARSCRISATDPLLCAGFLERLNGKFCAQLFYWLINYSLISEFEPFVDTKLILGRCIHVHSVRPSRARTHISEIIVNKAIFKRP